MSSPKPTPPVGGSYTSTAHRTESVAVKFNSFYPRSPYTAAVEAKGSTPAEVLADLTRAFNVARVQLLALQAEKDAGFDE